MLDAGALIALERDSRRVWALVEAAFDAGDRVQVPACALAQVWTGAPTQARLNQALKRCRTISLEKSPTPLPTVTGADDHGDGQGAGSAARRGDDSCSGG